MTTVAVSLTHGLVASDSRCSADNTMVSVQKIKVVKKGIIGAAGDWAEVLKFWEHLEKGTSVKDLGLTDDSSIEGIELTAAGIYIFEPSGRRYKIKDQFYAIGSGGPYAMGAMAMGATPEQAVAIAARFDPNTGGDIEAISLESVNVPKNKRR